MIVGVLLILMGIAGLIPSWTWASEPSWHAIVKIVIGLISVYVSATDK
jgi:hypothetical protein